MKSLFLKIFLSYWIAQALVPGAGHFNYAGHARARRVGHLGSAASQRPHQGGADLRAKRPGGGAALSRRSARLAAYPGLPAERSGYTMFQDAICRDGRNRWERVSAPPRRDFWQRVTPSPFRRQVQVAASGHRYTLVAFLPPNGPFGPGGVPGLSILIGIISSGLVCYLLARYLTSPVVRLRAATQRLAAGDLSARAGGLAARRRDEMAQLVRDFDTMAERLEATVNAQARLLNDISHELRSPLARLNVASALAHQRAGVEAHSALERIDLEAERLNELIGGLLTIARLDSGNDARQKSPIAVRRNDRGHRRRRRFRSPEPQLQGGKCRQGRLHGRGLRPSCCIARSRMWSATPLAILGRQPASRSSWSADEGGGGPEALIRIVDLRSGRS